VSLNLANGNGKIHPIVLSQPILLRMVTENKIIHIGMNIKITHTRMNIKQRAGTDIKNSRK